LKDRYEYGYEQSSDGDGDALCDPPDDNKKKHGQKATCLGVLWKKREKIGHKEKSWTKKEAYFFPVFHSSGSEEH